MRDLTREEVVAMWLWSAEYAAQNLSAIDWYAQLSDSRKRNVADFIEQYEAAAERDGARRGVQSMSKRVR